VYLCNGHFEVPAGDCGGCEGDVEAKGYAVFCKDKQLANYSEGRVSFAFAEQRCGVNIEGRTACTFDQRSILKCKNGQWQVLQTCGGLTACGISFGGACAATGTSACIVCK
jgi:hypothetical protein